MKVSIIRLIKPNIMCFILACKLV